MYNYVCESVRCPMQWESVSDDISEVVLEDEVSSWWRCTGISGAGSRGWRRECPATARGSLQLVSIGHHQLEGEGGREGVLEYVYCTIAPCPTVQWNLQ